MSVLLALAACGGSVSVVGDGGDNGADDGGGGSGGGGSSSGGSTSSGAGGSSSGTASSGGSGGGGSSGSGSSSGGPGPGQCPAAQPLDNTSCHESGLACEYGGVSDVQGCDTVARCNAAPGGQGALVWSVQGPTLNDCGSFSPACPSTYASVPQGSACSASGTVCDYMESRCECTYPGGPACVGSGCLHWLCQAPKAAGCPTRRPALGTACSAGAGTKCDYGSCDIEGGTAETCTNGVWTQTSIACPI